MSGELTLVNGDANIKSVAEWDGRINTDKKIINFCSYNAVPEPKVAAPVKPVFAAPIDGSMAEAKSSTAKTRPGRCTRTVQHPV